MAASVLAHARLSIYDAGYSGSLCNVPNGGSTAAPPPPTSAPNPPSQPPPPVTVSESTVNATCNPACQNSGKCYNDPDTGVLSCICDGTGNAACQQVADLLTCTAVIRMRHPVN